MWAAEAILKKVIHLESKDTWTEKMTMYKIKRGDKITITLGRNEKYALWTGHGIYDLPEEYVKEIVRVLSEK